MSFIRQSTNLWPLPETNVQELAFVSSPAFFCSPKLMIVSNEEETIPLMPKGNQHYDH